jgi:glucose dehydrogenase
MTKTHSLRIKNGNLAAPIFMALLAALACEARKEESKTQAATPAPAASPGITTATAPGTGTGAGELTMATEAELADHAAYAKGAGKELQGLQEDDAQWAIPGKNYAGTRYSTLNEITAANVSGLKEVWSMSTGTDKGLEGAPLVVGSTMYAHWTRTRGRKSGRRRTATRRGVRRSPAPGWW